MVKRHHQSQPATWQVITFGRIQTLTTELNNRNARGPALSLPAARSARSTRVRNSALEGRLLEQQKARRAEHAPLVCARSVRRGPGSALTGRVRNVTATLRE
jgi:hypothetical protein